jgi:hypothetical protein
MAAPRSPCQPPASVPFSLAPQCHGAACEGRDPMRLICGLDPDTLASYRTTTGAHIELRHSKKCGASWARTWGTEIGDRECFEARVSEAATTTRPPSSGPRGSVM